MTTLLTALRADLAPLMKRRETVGLRAVRSAIGAIENAEVTYITDPYTAPLGTEYVAGVARFGFAERIVRELDDDEMAAIVRAGIDERLAEAARLREFGEIDRALMLKAEALILIDRLEAYQAA
jgi:uncharacterized protein YqeY